MEAVENFMKLTVMNASTKKQVPRELIGLMDLREHSGGISHGCTLAIHLNEKVLQEAHLVGIIITKAEHVDVSMKEVALGKALAVAIAADESSH
jgi:hypothetical protein